MGKKEQNKSSTIMTRYLNENSLKKNKTKQNKKKK